MRAERVVKIGVTWVVFWALGAFALADPVVSNVRAQQRAGTGLVDIYYDVTGTVGQAKVSVAVSDDSGETYDVAVTSVSGDVGFGISFGTDRHIVWDALADAPGIRSETMRVQLTGTPFSEAVPLVSIPAGSFAMGDNLDGMSGAPVHTVTLSAYKMGETEVTWGQWQAVRDWAAASGYTDLTGIGAGKGEDHPVHSVTWYDVVKWCNAASEKSGLEPVYYLSDGGAVYRTGEVAPFIDYTKNGYRLPTEAEWEKAARGGLEGKRFPWGDTISHAEANYYASPSSYSYDVNSVDGIHPDYDEGAYPYTSPVRSFAANGLGLYDMAGNLLEWCGDWYGSTYYGSSPSADPAGPESGSYRVVRGGVWNSAAFSCRVANRGYHGPAGRDFGIGFRVSRSQSLLRSASYGGQALYRSESYVGQAIDRSASYGGQALYRSESYGGQAIDGSLLQTAVEAQSVSESGDFSLNTVTWTVSGGPFTGGSVTGLGIYLETTTATLTATPASGFVFAGWNGDASGAVNPLTVLVDADKTVGAEFITTGTYNRIEQLGLTAGVTQGEAAVVAAPGDYGLHTPAELQANYTTGLTAGLAQGSAAVVADPASYNLFNAEMIQTGLRLGGMRITDANGSKLISFNIESSEDLQTWTLEERIERSLVLPASGSLFIRVSVPEEDVVPLVSIPAGSFAMGDNLDGMSDAPVHTVTLSAYKMGETEVTWGQWQSVRDWAVANGYTDLTGIGAGKGEDHPVYNVNWYDVVKWCNAASEKVGLEPVYYLSDGGAVYRTGEVTPFIDYTKNGYRLPTEAEWEKAARGGLEGKRFPWGDTISHAEANYNARPNNYSYDENSVDGYHPDYDEGGFPYTSPVRSFAANGFGLYDMAGNLWEWCGDWYGSSYYGSSPSADPAGPESDSNRVLRGGNWYYDADYCRVAARDYVGPAGRNLSVGFRVSRR